MYSIASSTHDIAMMYGFAGTIIGGSMLGVLLGGAALLGLGFAAQSLSILFWHSDGTTNWLGRHWMWWDHMTYKPYAGYNRLRSRRWNMEHTA